MLAWEASGFSVDASVRITLNRPRCAELLSELGTPAAVLCAAACCARATLREPRPRRPDRPRPLRAAQTHSRQLGRARPRPKIHAAGGQWRRRGVQTAFRVRNHSRPSPSWQPPVAADFLSANQARSGRSSRPRSTSTASDRHRPRGVEAPGPADGDAVCADARTTPLKVARRVRSANDCRLNGSPVSGTVWQAVATTIARSIGGKSGLATATFMVFHCEIACGPPLPPASHLAFGESHTMARFRIANGGLFVNEQGESIALGVTDKNGSPPNGDASRRRNAAACPLPPRSGELYQVVPSSPPLAYRAKGSTPSRSQRVAALGQTAWFSQALGQGSYQPRSCPQILPKTRFLESLSPGMIVQSCPDLGEMTPFAAAYQEAASSGCPVASSTDSHRSPSGATWFCWLTARAIGMWTNRPCQRPTTISVRPASAA